VAGGFFFLCLCLATSLFLTVGLTGVFTIASLNVAKPASRAAFTSIHLNSGLRRLLRCKIGRFDKDLKGTECRYFTIKFWKFSSHYQMRDSLRQCQMERSMFQGKAGTIDKISICNKTIELEDHFRYDKIRSTDQVRCLTEYFAPIYIVIPDSGHSSSAPHGLSPKQGTGKLR